MKNLSQTWGVYHDFNITSPVQQVFAAVSDPEHLINWWPLLCEGHPELGAQYRLYFGPKYDWLGEVIRIVPNSTFHIGMKRSDDDWEGTRFGFDLVPSGNSTKLSFSHIGWKENNAHYRHSSFCWAMLLNGLKNYLEKGDIIPFDKRS